MGTKNYSSNFNASNLDSNLLFDVYAAKLKQICKPSVAYATTRYLANLQDAKSSIEDKLKRAKDQLENASWFKKIKEWSKISELEKKLHEAHTRIIDWVNSTYRHFFLISEPKTSLN